MEKIFNNYSLTDDEYFKILEDEEIEKFLNNKCSEAKELKEECKNFIIKSIHKTLTNNKN